MKIDKQTIINLLNDPELDKKEIAEILNSLPASEQSLAEAANPHQPTIDMLKQYGKTNPTEAEQGITAIENAIEYNLKEGK